MESNKGTRQFLGQWGVKSPYNLDHIKNKLEDMFTCFNKQPNERVIQAYTERIKGFDVKVIEKVIENLIVTSKFCPSISDVYQGLLRERPLGESLDGCSRCDQTGIICVDDKAYACKSCDLGKSMSPMYRRM